MTAQRQGRGIALLILNFGTGLGCS